MPVAARLCVCRLLNPRRSAASATLIGLPSWPLQWAEAMTRRRSFGTRIDI